MPEPEQGSARLIRACESLCDELRHRVGLTAFTIELDRPASTPLTIALRGPDVITHPTLRHDPRASARMDIPVCDGELRIATIVIEDARRAEYPPEARSASSRIVAMYAPEISSLLRSAV
jgi:hypothetical protein